MVVVQVDQDVIGREIKAVFNYTVISRNFTLYKVLKVWNLSGVSWPVCGYSARKDVKIDVTHGTEEVSTFCSYESPSVVNLPLKVWKSLRTH